MAKVPSKGGRMFLLRWTADGMGLTQKNLGLNEVNETLNGMLPESLRVKERVTPKSGGRTSGCTIAVNTGID